jgi:hypothetical protein
MGTKWSSGGGGNILKTIQLLHNDYFVLRTSNEQTEKLAILLLYTTKNC